MLLLPWPGRSATAVQAVTDTQSIAAAPGDTAEGLRRANLCSDSNPAGVGLRGEYFALPRQQGKPKLVRVDRTIEFGSISEVAPAGGGAPGSILWTGWIKAPISGRYRFDGGASHMRITVANLPMAGAGVGRDAGVDLAVGKFYPIRVELDQVLASDSFPIRLQWTTPYGARYGVPRQLLFLPTDTVSGTN